MRAILLLSVMATVSALGAERQPLERYQTLIDRQMFGPVPADFDPTKLPSEVAKSGSRAEKELTKEQEQVKKSVRFTVLNVTPAGETMVGFTDSKDPKNPLHYYLKVGESQNGWLVKEADPEEATMTICDEKGVEVTLTLGADSAAEAGAVSKPENRPANTRMSLRDRRRRQEAVWQAAADKREKERAEREERREKEWAERSEQLNQMLMEGVRQLRADRAAQSAKEAEKPAAETSAAESGQ